MEFEKLTAQVRTGRKKGLSRQLRRGGSIPAVCYGPDIEPITISTDPKVLFEALSGPLGQNVVMELTVEGDGAPTDPLLVMLQERQYHPVTRKTLHADFLHVSTEREVQVRVPFELVGKCIGVQTGGRLTQVFRSLPIRCLPTSVPEKIVLDVTTMDVGQLRKVSDLELPEGVTVTLEPNQTLSSVVAPSAVTTAASDDEEGEEAEASAEATE
jgi:large subunit ribosomal protein L25